MYGLNFCPDVTFLFVHFVDEFQVPPPGSTMNSSCPQLIVRFLHICLALGESHSCDSIEKMTVNFTSTEIGPFEWEQWCYKVDYLYITHGRRPWLGLAWLGLKPQFWFCGLWLQLVTTLTQNNYFSPHFSFKLLNRGSMAMVLQCSTEQPVIKCRRSCTPVPVTLQQVEGSRGSVFLSWAPGEWDKGICYPWTLACLRSGCAFCFCYFLIINS